MPGVACGVTTTSLLSKPMTIGTQLCEVYRKVLLWAPKHTDSAPCQLLIHCSPSPEDGCDPPRWRMCRHGHRHHEILFNDIAPTEPPVIWCNSPDCWTVCAYGTSPNVYRGARAWISDFFFTPIHRTDEIQEPVVDEPSVKRYQTFSEFNKLRYKGSQSSPSIPRVSDKASQLDRSHSEQPVLDISAENRSNSRTKDTRPVMASPANPYTRDPYFNVQPFLDIRPGNESQSSASEPQPNVSSPNTQAGAFNSNTSPATNTGYPYSSTSLHHQFPFPPQHNVGLGDSSFKSEDNFRNQMVYPYPSGYLKTSKSEPSHSTTVAPSQELYANYPGSQAPDYYRSHTATTPTTNPASYSSHGMPNVSGRTTSPLPHFSPIGSPSPKARQSSKTKKSRSSRSREKKPTPAYAEYSRDVQVLLGTQAAGRYSSYSPYGITKRL